MYVTVCFLNSDCLSYNEYFRSLLVKVTDPCFAFVEHPVDLLLRPQMRVWVNLTEHPIHPFLQFFRGQPQESVASQQLSLLADFVLLLLTHVLVLCDAQEHTLLGLELWNQGIGLFTLDVV